VQATLIQCTKSKRESVSPARELYDASDYFRDMREWAEARGDPFWILSARHGAVHPDDEIAPYDAVGLSDRQAQSIAEFLGEHHIETVRVCAGRAYLNPLIPELERVSIDVIDPFAGLGIGERRQRLQKRTAQLRHRIL